MAIYVPGKRDRHNRPLRGGNRSAVVILSLTAMVDMFTVLTIFLLQNYNTTGEVIELDNKVELPKATKISELIPAHVVVVTKDGILVDQNIVVPMAQAKAANDPVIAVLVTKVKDMFAKAEATGKVLGAIKKAVDQTKPEELRPKPPDMRKITVQADKSVEYSVVRKVMFSVTEAGATEINFAVLKDENKKSVN